MRLLLFSLFCSSAASAGDTRRVKPRYLNRLTWNRHVTPGASGARLRCAGQRNPFDGLP